MYNANPFSNISGLIFITLVAYGVLAIKTKIEVSKFYNKKPAKTQKKQLNSTGKGTFQSKYAIDKEFPKARKSKPPTQKPKKTKEEQIDFLSPKPYQETATNTNNKLSKSAKAVSKPVIEKKSKNEFEYNTNNLKSDLVKAIVFSEILGKPKSLQ